MYKIVAGKYWFAFVLFYFIADNTFGISVSDSIRTSHKILQKKVSCSSADASIKQILLNIGEKEDVNFAYSERLPSLEKKLTINFTNLTLAYALDSLFSNTEISYSLIEDFIVLGSKPVLAEAAVQAANAPSIVSDSSHAIQEFKKVALHKLNSYDQENKDEPFFKPSYVQKGIGFQFAADSARSHYKDDSLKAIMDTTVYASDSILRQETITNSAQKHSDHKKRSRIPKPAKDFNRSSLSLFFGMALCRWNMKINIPEQTDGNIDGYNTYSTRDFAYSEGLTYQYLPTKNLVIETGVNHTSISKSGVHNDSYVNFYNFSPRQDPANTAFNQVSKSYDYSYKFDYLGVPLLVGIRSNPKKVTISLYAGMAFHYLLTSKTPPNYDSFRTKYYVNPDRGSIENRPVPPGGGGFPPNFRPNYYAGPTQTEEIVENKTSVRHINFSMVVKTEIALRISKSFQVFISPGVEYFLKPVYDNNAPVNEKVYLLAVAAGLRFGF